MERIEVSTGRSYEVLIGSGIISEIGKKAKELFPKTKKAAIISDETTHALFSGNVKNALEDDGFEVLEITLPAGENSKSAENYVKLLNLLANEKFSRSDIIVALGGGVIGDLSGFVAASYLRGISFIQIPTTLLAAVDSSVGGKTAINLDAGKNLAGAFWQPSLVLCDTDIISDLPDDIFADGMAEVIKYGAIRSEKILKLITDGAKENLIRIISECVGIKRDIVSNDEFDVGERQLLNFGHTPAHSIEKMSGFEISHGRAVAIGMCIMAKASETLGYCKENVSDEIACLCRKYSLPTECEFSEDVLFEVAMSDKKRSGGYITLVLPKMRGESFLLKIPEDEMIKFFKAGLEKA